MDTQTKTFLVLFIAVTVSSVAASYHRYVVAKDYVVETEAECDPSLESCFVHVCDSSVGEECTGNPDEDTSYYKIVRRNAKNIPSCDPSLDDCQALSCVEGEPQCEIILCDSTNQDVDCSDPSDFPEETLENSEGDPEETDAVTGDAQEGVSEDMSVETDMDDASAAELNDGLDADLLRAEIGDDSETDAPAIGIE